MAGVLQRLQSMKPGDPLDWRQVREQIHDEHARAASTAERVALLETYRVVMDAAEKESGFDAENLEAFRETRLKDYHLLLVQEARIGDNACVETMYAVIEREIAAGRMSPDDTLRETAVKFMAEPHMSREELMEEDRRKREKEARTATGWRGTIHRFFGTPRES